MATTKMLTIKKQSFPIPVSEFLLRDKVDIDSFIDAALNLAITRQDIKERVGVVGPFWTIASKTMVYVGVIYSIVNYLVNYLRDIGFKFRG